MMEELNERARIFLLDVWTLAIACMQFGDSCKGKVIDCLAPWADIIVRGVGGPNTGNTVRVGNVEIVLHLLPAGILHPNILNLIGKGVAVDPKVLLEELTGLRQVGFSGDNLKVSLAAKLILPHDILLDRVGDAARGTKKIGTTGRGMGPCAVSHVNRVGPVVNDLLNETVFRRKLEANLEVTLRLLRTYDPEVIRQVLQIEQLEGGRYWHPEKLIDADAIAERYLGFGRELAPLIADTDAIVQEALGRKRIILAGSQGNLLSLDDGTYPYVTPADCTPRGLAKGAGIRERNIDFTIGVVKAFVMSRVGGGPFPTEFGGERSVTHCDGMTRAKELAEYSNVSVNDPDELRQGFAFRHKGDEYGATTGRARRLGWLDLPLLRHSRHLLTPRAALAVTKLDTQDEAETIKICTGYTYVGPDYRRGSTIFRTGDVIREAVMDVDILAHCEPLYETFPGWRTPIRHLRNSNKIPQELFQPLRLVENEMGTPIMLLSVGSDREDTIFVDPLRLAWKG